MKWSNLPVESIKTVEEMGIMLNKKLGMLFNKEITKYNTLYKVSNTSLITLSGTEQTIAEIEVNNAESTKDYQLFFTAAIGSSGETTWHVYVDGVQQKEFTVNADVVSFVTFLTVARGVRTITVKGEGTGTVAIDLGELGVYL
jgi:hypothetical protein